MRVFGVSAVRIGNVLQTLSRFEKSGGNQLFLVGSEESLFTKKTCSSPSHERVVSRDANYSGANGDREKFIFPVQLTTSRISNHTVPG